VVTVTDVTAKADGHLDYISQLCKQLGLNDPVETYLTPLVGKWSDLHDEAARWRTAATAAENVTHRLTTPLGGLDAAWQGADADSFMDYMQRVGLAGNDMSDAMNAMADALEKTAEGIRQIVQEMVDMLTDTAEQSSDAMTVPVSGSSRAAQYLDELDQPVKKLHQSVRDVLQAFTKLCDGVQSGQSFDAVTMAHRVPVQNWAPAPPPVTTQPAAVKQVPVATSVHTTVPAHTPAPVTHTAAAAAHTPAAAAHTSADTSPAAAHPAAAQATAAHAGGGGSALVGHSSGGVAAGGMSASESGPAAQSGAMADPTTGSISGQLPVTDGAGGSAAGAAAGGQQQGGMPMSGMGGMRGGQGGGDQEHKSKIRISGDVKDLFGKPERTAPPTIGGS
jgi:uncharacterized protein YukE